MWTCLWGCLPGCLLTCLWGCLPGCLWTCLWGCLPGCLWTCLWGCGLVGGSLAVNHPFSGLDYALLSNFLFLIKRGPKNTKTGKQHKTKHPQKNNPPHDCNLNGGTTVFQHCRMQKSRKTKNCLKCGAHPPCCIVQETIFLFLSLSKYH